MSVIIAIVNTCLCWNLFDLCKTMQKEIVNIRKSHAPKTYSITDIYDKHINNPEFDLESYIEKERIV